MLCSQNVYDKDLFNYATKMLSNLIFFSLSLAINYLEKKQTWKI